MKHPITQQWLMLMLLIWLVPGSELSAASIQWKQNSYSHFADGQPLEQTLKDLMSSENIPVIQSKKLKATVHIHLENMPPQEMLNRLAKMYHFVWYYDGQALFINEMNELQSATLKLKYMSPRAFTLKMKELDIYDEHYNWRYSEDGGLIYFSGPPRLVGLVMEMAKVYDTEDSSSVYKWVDTHGITTFSTSPPLNKSRWYEIISPMTGKSIKQSSAVMK